MHGPDVSRELLRHRHALLVFIQALTRDFAAAEEIFQEVSLAILEEAARNKEVREFQPWAREIVRRRVAAWFRTRSDARRRTQPLSGELLDAVDAAFDEVEADPEADGRRMHALRQCLKGLDQRARELVELRFRGDCPPKTIAEQKGLRPDHVKVLLWRARHALARCVKLRLQGGGAA